jgi:uncharacterized protein
MREQRPMQAPEAALTEYEKNSHAQPFERLSDDFTFQMSGSMPHGRSNSGRDEFIGFWEAVAKGWTYFRYDTHEIIDAADTVVVPVKTGARSVHGIPLENEHLFKVKNGRAVFARLYADTARGRAVVSGHAASSLSQSRPQRSHLAAHRAGRPTASPAQL